MVKRLRPRITFANVLSCLAVFVALGSGAYAATQLPKNSVGTRQLKRGAVNAAKIKKGSITSLKVKNRSLRAVDFKAGQLPAGPRGPQGLTGATGPQGLRGPAGVAGPVTYVSDDAATTCNVDPETEECLPGVAGYARASAIARCPNDSQPLGGGFHLFGVTGSDTPGAVAGEVVSSEPFADEGAAEPNSWRVLYDTNSYTFELIRAWAACVPVAP